MRSNTYNLLVAAGRSKGLVLTVVPGDGAMRSSASLWLEMLDSMCHSTGQKCMHCRLHTSGNRDYATLADTCYHADRESAPLCPAVLQSFINMLQEHSTPWTQ